MPETKDWLILGGLGLSAYAIYLLFRPTPVPDGDIIKAKWENLNIYLLQITADGREPTTEEWAQYEAMWQDGVVEEHELVEASQPAFLQLVDSAERLAKQWYLVPIVVFTPIAGYITVQLFRDWYRYRCRRCTRPRCTKDGEEFATKEELADHIAREHTVTLDATMLAAAQVEFTKIPYWTRATVAAESGLYNRAYHDWRTLSQEEIYLICWAMMSVVAIGAVAATFAGPLGVAAALLLLI